MTQPDPYASCPVPSFHVMIVDDHRADVLLTTRALRTLRPDVRCTVYTDPMAALDVLTQSDRTEDQTPDLVLLDLDLPHLKGCELLAELRIDPLTRHLTVVACSASSDPYDLRDARDLGADGFLSKPFTLAQLESVLQHGHPLWPTEQAGMTPRFFSCGSAAKYG